MKKSYIIIAAFLLFMILRLKDESALLTIALMWFAVNMVVTKLLWEQWENNAPSGWLLFIVVILWIAFALFLTGAISIADTMRRFREKEPLTSAVTFYQATAN